MEDQNPIEPQGHEGSGQEKSSNNNTIITVLVVALILAIVAIIFLVAVNVFGGGSESESGTEPTLPPPNVTVEATVIPPTPEAGDPTATVTAGIGVNVRTGPGLDYLVIGTAPFGATLEVVGLSQDGTWWVINIPGAPNNYGWVADEYVEVENGEDVPAIPAPATPTPVATATSTATPAPDINFSASRTSINAGESATLSWSVENIRAVYVYPVGGQFENYPVTGQGSREVQPFITTTYELLTINPDDSTSSSRIEITVINGLTSSRWLLQSYTVPGSGSKPVIPGTEISARFATNGDLSGSAGCNTYSGGFTAYDQTLRTSNLTTSLSLCQTPDGIMEQEGEFLSSLQRASKMTISAGQLTVFDSAGNRLLVFFSG